jgi:hypothetical protein
VALRKLYVFTVERLETVDPAGKEGWARCGMVLLPDYATRRELAHALLVFGLPAPQAADRVVWDYDASGWVPGCASSPLPRPWARILLPDGTPLVRLTVAAKKNLAELGRGEPSA